MEWTMKKRERMDGWMNVCIAGIGGEDDKNNNIYERVSIKVHNFRVRFDLAIAFSKNLTQPKLQS
jgi:hypothetical protein